MNILKRKSKITADSCYSSYQRKRSAWPLYLVSILLGAMIPLLFTQSLVEFSAALDFEISKNTGMIIFAISGVVCSFTYSKITADTYVYTDNPFQYFLMALFPAAVAIPMAFIFLVGLCIMIIVGVLWMIIYSLSEML